MWKRRKLIFLKKGKYKYTSPKLNHVLLAFLVIIIDMELAGKVPGTLLRINQSARMFQTILRSRVQLRKYIQLESSLIWRGG